MLIGLFAFSGGAAAEPCTIADDGSGTVELPPIGCEYLSAAEPYVILNELPPGTTIELVPIHKDFFCYESTFVCSILIPPGLCEATGGSLGGDSHCAGLAVNLTVTGTGSLSSFSRNLSLPLDWEAHTAPRNPGDPIQDFDTDLYHMEGAIFGDPDFSLLRITAGSDYGLPSPGHTTLSKLPNGDFNVDSFFDVSYRIDFQGAPGGSLDGLSGSTTGTLRIETGEPPPFTPLVPGLSGHWLWLCGGFLAATSLGVMRWQRRHADPAGGASEI